MLTFKPRKTERGQSLVEFAFVFPILLGVLIGLMFFSIIFYSYVTLQSAVREGASVIVHCPSLTCDDPKLNSGSSIRTITDIQTLVREKSFSLNSGGLNILVEPNQSQWVRGAQISVSAAYYVPLPTVNVPTLGNSTIRLGTIQITAQSVMTVE